MAIATSTALLLGGAIAGGASVYGANRAAGAAEEGAEIQGEAADRALALQREMFDLERQDFAPYRNLGVSSVGGLSYLTGGPDMAGLLGGMQTTSGQIPGQNMQPSNGAAAPMPTAPNHRQPPRQPENTIPQPRTPSLLSSLGQADPVDQQSASSFVRMVAPTGEERDVPARDVPMYLQRGAQVKR